MEHIFAIGIIVLLTTPLIILAWRGRRYFWAEDGLFSVFIFMISFWIVDSMTEWWFYKYFLGCLMAGVSISIIQSIRSSIRNDKPEPSGNIDQT